MKLNETDCLILNLDRRATNGNRQKGPRNVGDGSQNEDSRRTTPRLPEAHCRSKRESLRQRRTLQHAANRRKALNNSLTPAKAYCIHNVDYLRAFIRKR